MKKKDIKTEWNLGLLYKSHKDPQIEKDIKTAEKLYDNFAKKYSKKNDYLKNESKLLLALKDYEKLFENPIFNKPIIYFHYSLDLNAKDEYAEAMVTKISNRITKASNGILFFGLKISKIEKKIQLKFLKSKKLKKYKYYLKTVFNTGKYDLTEPEEKLNNLKDISNSMWESGVSKAVNKKTVNFKNKEIPLSEAFSKIQTLKTKERRELHGKLMSKLKEVEEFSESEINALFTNKKVMDEIRGFKEPYSARILNTENNEKNILDLVDVVTNSFKLSHKFYKIKAKILSLIKLEYPDRSVEIGKINRKFSFEESVKILEESFSELNPRYKEILNRFLKKGQIDVYPKKGKRGGAYCSSSTSLPTWVFLNSINDFDSLIVFAHEMGHAIHSEFSKEQPGIYEDYSLSVAETASTFFENVVFYKVFEKLSEKEKIIALHNKLNGNISTIFRQIACFNFELELHKEIKQKGFVPKEEIIRIMNKNMKAYLGPIFNLKQKDGYFFIYWSHIRRPFYVYTYAFGEIVSDTLYENYKKEKNYVKNINKFLSAGGSDTPENIFKNIGININKKFFETGLKKIEKEINEFEKLAKSVKYKI